MAPGTSRCPAKILGRGATAVPPLPQVSPDGLYAMLQRSTQPLYRRWLHARPEGRWHTVPAPDEHRRAAPANPTTLPGAAIQHQCHSFCRYSRYGYAAAPQPSLPTPTSTPTISNRRIAGFPNLSTAADFSYPSRVATPGTILPVSGGEDAHY